MKKNNLLKDELARSGLDFSKRKLKKPRPYKNSKTLEKKYEKILIEYVRQYRQTIKDVLFNQLKQIKNSYDDINKNIGLDGYVEDLDTTFNQLSFEADLVSKNFEQTALQVGADISSYSLSQHTKVVNSVFGVSPVTSEPWLVEKEKIFVRENAKLIKKMTAETTDTIEQLVKSGLRDGLRVEQIEAQIVQKIGDGTVKLSPSKMSMSNRAKLIARDQTTKYYADLNKTRQEDLGVELYTWQTANDERVRGNPSGKYPDARPSHYAIDGALCRWDNRSVYSVDGGKTWISRPASWPQLHPGEDYQCRCYAEPYLMDLIE